MKRNSIPVYGIVFCLCVLYAGNAPADDTTNVVETGTVSDTVIDSTAVASDSSRPVYAEPRTQEPDTVTTANSDSLKYEEIIATVKASGMNTTAHSSEIETAETLAQAGIFLEAVEILEKFVLNADTQPASDTVIKQKSFSAHYTLFSDYNDNKDIDLSIKTTVQKDSIARVKAFILGNGLLMKHAIDRPWLSQVRNDLYISNIVYAWICGLQGVYFDSLLTLENEFWIEKVMSKKYDNKWRMLAFKNDSTDLISDIFKAELSFSNREKTLLFTAPGKYSWSQYRTNTLFYKSKSNFSVNPFLEFRPVSGNLILSANWYLEYYNYYCSKVGLRDTIFGQIIRDTMPMYIPVNAFDMFVTQPEASFSLFLNKVTVELRGHINSEYFLNIGNPVAREKTVTPQDTFFMLEDNGNARTSMQREAEAKFSFRFFKWLTARIKARYLYGTNNYDFPDLDSIQITGTQKIPFTEQYSIWGNDLVLNHVLEFKFPFSLKIAPGLTWNQRYAPIYRGINGDTLYLWETFDAHEPMLEVTWNPKILYVKISGAYRNEYVKRDNAYLKEARNGSKLFSSSTKWITKWDITLQVSEKFYFYFMGNWEPKKYSPRPYIPDADDVQHNLNMNCGLQVKF